MTACKAPGINETEVPGQCSICTQKSFKYTSLECCSTQICESCLAKKDESGSFTCTKCGKVVTKTKIDCNLMRTDETKIDSEQRRECHLNERSVDYQKHNQQVTFNVSINGKQKSSSATLFGQLSNIQGERNTYGMTGTMGSATNDQPGGQHELNTVDDINTPNSERNHLLNKRITEASVYQQQVQENIKNLPEYVPAPMEETQQRESNNTPSNYGIQQKHPSNVQCGEVITVEQLSDELTELRKKCKQLFELNEQLKRELEEKSAENQDLTNCNESLVRINNILRIENNSCPVSTDGTCICCLKDVSKWIGEAKSRRCASIESDCFALPIGTRFIARLYLDGEFQGTDAVTLKIFCVSDHASYLLYKVTACLVDQQSPIEQKRHIIHSTIWIPRKNSQRVWPKFMPANRLHKFLNPYVVNDSLTLLLYIRKFQGDDAYSHLTSHASFDVRDAWHQMTM